MKRKLNRWERKQSTLDTSDKKRSSHHCKTNQESPPGRKCERFSSCQIPSSHCLVLYNSRFPRILRCRSMSCLSEIVIIFSWPQGPNLSVFFELKFSGNSLYLFFTDTTFGWKRHVWKDFTFESGGELVVFRWVANYDARRYYTALESRLWSIRQS